MALPKLVSFRLCPFVHRSAMLLHEKGVKFEIAYIDLKNKPAWFLEMSPRGKVPLLVVDGARGKSSVLFESSVINEYLDETIPPRLLPEDPLERARERAWIEVANDLFAAQYALVSAADADAFERAREKIDQALESLEKELRGPFFAGDKLGLVDVALAPAFYRLALLEKHSSLRPYAGRARVAEWGRRLAERASVREGAPPDFEDAWIASIRAGNGYVAREKLAR